MQKNTKDLKNKEETINQKTATNVAKKSTKSKSSSSKSNTSTAKKTATKKKTTTSSVAKKAASKNTKKDKVDSTNNVTDTKTTVSKKRTSSKETKTKSTKSVTSVTKIAAKTSSKKNSSNSAKAGKSTSKKSVSKSMTKPKAPSRKKTTKVDIIEYYDLPYRYNETVVKILAQTPTTLFVYWDISDEDRKNYINKYGENFFENTFPILIVHNRTMNYSFEIEINDFANSWYFNVNDAKCNYEIELGRRAKPYKINLPNNYMYVASSNIIEAPNNRILFEKNQRTLFFRNVKNNTTIEKDVSKFEFMKYAGQIYNIYDVYMKIYKNEELENLEKNPSSSF